MHKEISLTEILAHAEVLRAEQKYTEAIKHLQTYLGRISTDADATLRNAIAEIRRNQVEAREEVIKAAIASRTDLTKELEEIEELHIRATSEDLWLDEEIGQSDERKELAAYRNELSDPKSQVRADIIVSRVEAGFAPGDSRQANWEWLRAQRRKLESIPFREGLPALRKRVQEQIDRLAKQAQKFDSRTQHLEFLPLIEYYTYLWERGVEETVEPEVQGDQVIEAGQGRRVKVEERLKTLRRDMAALSLTRAREYFSQIAQVIGQEQGQEDTFSVNLVKAWNDSPVEARRLNPELDRFAIRKHIHLGLYQLDPKKYIPKYKHQTDATESEDDPRPQLFDEVGLLDEAAEVERALNSASGLLEMVERWLSSAELADRYTAYHHHPRLVTLQDIERETLEPYEKEKKSFESQPLDDLLDDQLKEQIEQVKSFRQRLQNEPFFKHEHKPRESQEKLDELVKSANDREEQLKTQLAWREKARRFKALFERHLDPFDADACGALYRQIESLPEDERKYLESKLDAQISKYHQLADEGTTFTSLKKAFEAALAAQRERSPADLLQSTERKRYLEVWQSALSKAERYSDVQKAAQSHHWSEGRFYYLFSSAMSKCLEIGDLDPSDENRRSYCEKAKAQLAEIRQPLEPYVEHFAALKEALEQITADVTKTLDATRAARELWQKRIEPLINSRDYLERNYLEAERLINEEISGQEQSALRERLYNEWRKALEEQIAKFI